MTRNTCTTIGKDFRTNILIAIQDPLHRLQNPGPLINDSTITHRHSTSPFSTVPLNIKIRTHDSCPSAFLIRPFHHGDKIEVQLCTHHRDKVEVQLHTHRWDVFGFLDNTRHE
jgi:hypothetical protein